jgi:ketosteroid isomerase-like protein/N-acetylglutamate synthase-like GNAT family acetyltransferase
MAAPAQAGVALASDLYHALNQGDMEAFFDLLHPEVELREEFIALEVAVYRGHDGVREWLRRSSEVLSGFRFEPLRFMRLEDSVVIPVRLTARGAGSGAEVTADLVHMGQMSDGKISLLAAYPDLQSAVAAAATGIETALEPLDGPDAHALHDAFQAELRERYGGNVEPNVKPNVDDCSAFLVARDEAGRAVACGALCPLDDGAVELKRMYVRPEDRGRGLGWVILIALELEAQRQGFGVVRLGTGDFQPEALALYRAAGYREIPPYGAHAERSHSHSFERRLG